MTIVFPVLDLFIAVAAFLSGFFWWQASRGRMRRICREEMLDHADFNRMVIAFNRTQILNARAAITTAITGILATLRLSGNMIVDLII